MLKKDFKLRLQDIKEHVRAIDNSFAPGISYEVDSHLVALVQELACLAETLTCELSSDNNN